MANLSKIYSAKVGLETAYGDGGASPTNVPFFYSAGAPKWKPDWIENEVYGGSLDRNTAWNGKITSALVGKWYAKGSGTAGTAPEWGKVMQSCGFGETISAGVSVVYSPLNSSIKSATYTVNIDGKEYVLKGMRAESLDLDLEAGKPAVWSASLIGLYTRPSAVAYSGPTFADAAVKPVPVSNMALTINGNTFTMPKFSLNLKYDMFVGDSVNSTNAYGIQEIVQIGRSWGGKFSVWRDSNNDIELETLMDSSTEVAFASTGIGSVAGNKMAISGSTMQITAVNEASLNGIAGFECEFRINKHATLANVLSVTMT